MLYIILTFILNLRNPTSMCLFFPQVLATFHLVSKTVVSLINSSRRLRSRTTTVRREMHDCVKDALGGTEGRGALGPVSRARGFSSTLEDALASEKFARRAVRIPTSGLPRITSRTAKMVRPFIPTERAVLQRCL